MADSVGFYNWNFSILNSKNLNFLNIKKVYARSIPVNLIKECALNDSYTLIPYVNYIDLIPNWTKQQKCIEIIENALKNE